MAWEGRKEKTMTLRKLAIIIALIMIALLWLVPMYLYGQLKENIGAFIFGFGLLVLISLPALLEKKK